MTLKNAAWAIDGALLNAALARTEAYAATSGAEGIVTATDLKVEPLSTPGQGLRINNGAGLVLNRYQGSLINQTYTVVNVGTHTVGSSLMPASNPAQQTYIVAIAVGDPEFSQAGHPFMTGSDPAPGEEDTFEYVRPVVVLESTFNSRNYPAIALARLTIPANTTTITSDMITDLRKLANPRTQLAMAHVNTGLAAGVNDYLDSNAMTWERWPNIGVLTTQIPSWATKAKVFGFIEGAVLDANASLSASIRGVIEGTALATGNTEVADTTTAAERRQYNIAGIMDVTSVAGQTKTFSVQAVPINAGSRSKLRAVGSTSVFLQVYFEEQPV